MTAVGWEVAGIEFDPEAAAKAKEVTPNIFVGDPSEARFPDRGFDLVTAFHVVEHLPDPLGALRNMLRWVATGGLVIVEVPNVGGWGGRLFEGYWSGLDFPRHLVHFTPQTFGLMVEQAGGDIIGTIHKAKPRYLIRSLRFLLRDRTGFAARWARSFVGSPIGEGALKLVLELVLPLAEATGRGEAVRYFIRRTGEKPAWYDAP